MIDAVCLGVAYLLSATLLLAQPSQCVVTAGNACPINLRDVPPANPYGNLAAATRAVTLDLWSCVAEQTCVEA